MKAQFTYESHPSDPKRTVGTFPSLPHLAAFLKKKNPVA